MPSPNPSSLPASPKWSKSKQDETKKWLKDHKHDGRRVDDAVLDTDEDLAILLCELHKVSEQEYRMVTG